MKICSKCGQSIPEEAKFCSFCGESFAAETPVYDAVPEAGADMGNREEEQDNLDSLSNRLKWERLAWKINGIVLLVCTILFLLIGTIGTVVGGVFVADSADYGSEYYNGEYYYEDDYGYYSDDLSGEAVVGAVGFVYGIIYGGLGLFLFLPMTIVNLVLAKNVGKYRENLYTDCTDAVNHATSVGSIVLGAIFNEYALIAIIINFILTKKNKEIFDRIEANQKAYNNHQL